MVLNKIIDSIIKQYKERLESNKKGLEHNMKLFGWPSVYWNKDDFDIEMGLIKEFIEELEELKFCKNLNDEEKDKLK